MKTNLKNTVLYAFLTLNLICIGSIAAMNENQNNTTDYEQKEKELLQKADTLEYMRDLGLNSNDMKDEKLIQFYHEKAQETEKWNNFQVSAINNLKDNEIHDNYGKETDLLIDVLNDNNLSIDQKIFEIKRLINRGINHNSKRLLKKIIVWDSNLFEYFIKNNTTLLNLDRETFLYSFFENIQWIRDDQADLSKNIELFLNREYESIENLPTALEKITFLLNLKKSLNKAYEGSYLKVPLRKILDLRMLFAEPMNNAITIINTKIITIIDSLETTVDNYSEIQKIFYLLCNNTAVDIYKDIFLVDKNRLRIPFVWYFNQTKHPTILDFKTLIKFSDRFEENEYIKLLKIGLKSRSLQQPNDHKDAVDSLLYKTYLQTTDINLLSNNQKIEILNILFPLNKDIEIEAYKTMMEDNSIGLWDNNLSIPLLAQNFPRNLKELKELFSNTINYNDIRKFVLAGYLSRLHKINNNGKQIGYEPAQLILQYVGSDIKYGEKPKTTPLINKVDDNNRITIGDIASRYYNFN